MKTTVFPRALGALALSASLCAAVAPAQAANFSSVVAFGDSLSDNGRLFALTGQPSAPYVNGRFSNGQVSIEYMAQAMNLQLTDYAYGGATTGLLNVSAPVNAFLNTGLLGQVDMFKADKAGKADSSALYFVYAGANDFLSAPANEAPQTTITNAITNLTTAVMKLYGMGARSFLLPTLPDLGLTVRSINQNALTPGFAAQASLLSATFNQFLTGAYAQLAAQLPDERFFVVDSVLAQTTALKQFREQGGNTTQSCISQLAFPNCSGYFYFDDIHPTTDAHARFALSLVAAVPEPGSWMLAGVALLAAGVGTRSRRRAAATQA